MVLIFFFLPLIIKNYYKTESIKQHCPSSKSHPITESDFPLYRAAPAREVCAAFLPFHIIFWDATYIYGFIFPSFQKNSILKMMSLFLTYIGHWREGSGGMNDYIERFIHYIHNPRLTSKKQHSLKQTCEQVYLHVLDKYFLIKLNHRAEQIAYTYIMICFSCFKRREETKVFKYFILNYCHSVTCQCYVTN